MRGRFQAVAVAGVAVAVEAAAGGMGPNAVEPDFQINTVTAGAQVAPDVAASPDGGFVVVWESDSSSGSDTSGRSVQARRYDGSAQPLDAAEFQVNVFTVADQREPSLTVRPDGSFVTVWVSGAAGSEDVRWRRFAADGSPLDPTGFVANTYTTGSQVRPRVVARENGEFLVTWQSDGSAGGDTDGSSVQARRYSAAGTALDASEFQVNTVTVSNQFAPAAAVTTGGDFVLVWSTASGARGRRYLADGTPIDGADFAVSSSPDFAFSTGVAPLPDDGFVVAWGSYSGGPDDPDVEMRRFDAGALPIDPVDVRVNALVTGGQIPGAVVAAADGSFAVSFASDGSFGDDTSSDSAQARRYGSDGAAVDPNEFQLNAYTMGPQSVPCLALLADGNLVAVWPGQGSFGDDGDSWSIQARRFRVRELFADGFESGGTAAWDQAVP